QQCRPDPVARVPPKAPAPRQAERGDEPASGGQPPAALQAVLLPVVVRRLAARAALLVCRFAHPLALPGFRARLELFRTSDGHRFLGLFDRLLLGLGICLAAAARAEVRVGLQRMSALLAADDGLGADRTAAVGAEMRAPGHRCTAFAGGRRAPRARDRGEHRVEVVDPLFERDDLAAAVDQELVAKGRAAVHLQRQPAEVADALLPRLEDLPARASQRSGGGRPPYYRRRARAGFR